jgi:hypothetical protein
MAIALMPEISKTSTMMQSELEENVQGNRTSGYDPALKDNDQCSNYQLHSSSFLRAHEFVGDSK